MKFSLISCLLLYSALTAGQAHAANLQNPSELDDYQAINLRLLNASLEAGVKAGVHNVYTDLSDNQVQQDVVASLLSEYAAGDLTLEMDTAAWMIRALGVSKSERYAGVLNSLKGRSAKLNRHLRRALKDVTFDGAVFAYDPGWRTALDEQLRVYAAQHESASNPGQIGKGDSIRHVVSAAGAPETVGLFNAPAESPGENRAVWRLALRYPSKGLHVVFKRDPSGWRVQRLHKPFASHSGEVYVPQLLTGQGVEGLREFGQELFLSPPASDALLDVLAWRVLRDLNEEDKNAADSLAWLCRAIGQSGNPRYRDMLNKVADSAASKKLQRNARVARKQLSKEDVPQYPIQ